MFSIRRAILEDPFICAAKPLDPSTGGIKRVAICAGVCWPRLCTAAESLPTKGSPWRIGARMPRTGLLRSGASASWQSVSRSTRELRANARTRRAPFSKSATPTVRADVTSACSNVAYLAWILPCSCRTHFDTGTESKIMSSTAAESQIKLIADYRRDGTIEQVELLDGGAQVYPRMLAAIVGARTYVRLEVYAFSPKSPLIVTESAAAMFSAPRSLVHSIGALAEPVLPAPR